MNGATEKLMNLEIFNDTFSGYLNNAFFIEVLLIKSTNPAPIYSQALSDAKEVVKELKKKCISLWITMP